MVRLDQYLAASGEHSRSQATHLIRSGLVQVNGIAQRNPGYKLNPEESAITLQGQPVVDQRLQYCMLHKPAGVLTSARDAHAPTVMDLLPPALARRKVLPAGRLDKDTTGLLLLTNDGALAHRLLSPRWHVPKEYHAWVEGCLTDKAVQAFAQGIPLGDFTAMPATLCILQAGASQSLGKVWLEEGKYHQVKRMFAALGHPVLSLHRAAFGPLRLPADLPAGAYRPLTGEELSALRQATESPALPQTSAPANAGAPSPTTHVRNEP